MDTNELRAAISIWLDQMEAQPEDLHEVHLRLIELLDQFRATGQPLPEDLVELEQRLTRDVEGVKS